jgi:hypothetical protein
MKRASFLIIALLIILAVNSWGFDGQRKGFVLGGGLGFGPVASTSLEGFSGSEDRSGLGFNFIIGYAWDNRNMLVYLNDGVVFNVTTIYHDKVGVFQGFSGIGYYHYFGRIGNSGFINAGLGLQQFSSLDSKYESNDVGGGILLGGGYEFVRHVQVYANLSFGKTSVSVLDFNHSQLTVGVAAVAF